MSWSLVRVPGVIRMISVRDIEGVAAYGRALQLADNGAESPEMSDER